MNKLVRVSNGKICGVCGGIAQYFGIDATIVRLVWAIGTIVTGIGLGLLIYIACAFIIPKEDDILD